MNSLLNILLIILCLFGFIALIGLSVIFALWYMENKDE
jgi:hypothetical protein